MNIASRNAVRLARTSRRRGWAPAIWLAAALLIAASLLAPRARAQLYVSSYAGEFANAGTVGKYDPNTGAAIDASFISGLTGPSGLALDNNGHLFVASAAGSSGIIGIYDANTGAAINSTFISLAGFADPQAIVLDGLGNLYVADLGGRIGKFNAVTGATINASLVTTAHPFGLAVDSHRRLYATNNTLYSVLVFDADAGADIANPLVHGSENGVEDPIGIVEDGKGHIFVANEGLGITEFDALTGTRIDTPPLGFSPAWGLAMDSSGYLYEAGGGTVGKMDSVTGEGTSLFITGLTDPQFIAIAPLPEPGWLLAAALVLPSLLARRLRDGTV